MSNLKLLYKIMRLKGMKLTDFWFAKRGKELAWSPANEDSQVVREWPLAGGSFAQGISPARLTEIA